MESNYLLEALDSLKQNLAEIQSAREQVETTVAASDRLQNVVSGYVTAISKLQDDVKKWQDEIKNYQQAKITDVEGSISHLKSSCDSAVSAFDKDVQKASASFSDDANKTLSAFTKENEKFAEQIAQLNTLHNSIKQAASEIESIKGVLDALSTDLKESQKSQDVALDKINQKATNLPNAIQQAADNNVQKLNELHSALISRIDIIDGKENVIKDKLEQSVEKISTEIQSSRDNVTKNIQINRWILIAGIVILVILQIFM